MCNPETLLSLGVPIKEVARAEEDIGILLHILPCCRIHILLPPFSSMHFLTLGVLHGYLSLPV